MTSAAPTEALESRCVPSATVVSQIPVQSLAAGNGAVALTLSQFFTDPQVPAGDTVVNIETNLPTPYNSIPIALTNAATPKTVANFLSYINSGEYSNTIIYRSAYNPPTSTNPFVIQGGGYTTSGARIATLQNLAGEYQTATLKNATAGTIAMALSGGPDTANSDWFINLADNSFLDNNSTGLGPFTAFGQTLYNGLNVALYINSLPTVNDTMPNTPTNVDSRGFGPWSNLPVQQYSGANDATVASVPSADYITLNPVVVPGGLTYAVSSSNTNIVQASVSGDTLSLVPAGGGGSAMITVTATDLGGGVATSTFAVNVVSSSPVATVGKGAAKNIFYTDPNGTAAVVALNGPGTAAVSFTGSGITQSTGGKGITFTGSGLGIASISTSNTTAASVLTITTRGGTKSISVASITAGDLKSLLAKGVTLTGNFESSGNLGSVMLASAGGGTLGANSIGNLVVSGAFSDTLALAGTGTTLKTAKLGAVSGDIWSVGGSSGSITLASASNWTPLFAGPVKTLHITGDLTGSLVRFTGAGGDVNMISVGGSINTSTINAVGDIGTIVAGSLVSSEIEAGVSGSLAGNTLPPNATAFVTPDTIAAVRLKSGGFSNAYILAQSLGSLSLGTLQTNNHGTADGVAATSIKSITATANKRFALHNQTPASNVAAELTNLGVSLGDVVIELL